MNEFKLLIDGELVDSEESLEVINPATGQVFTRVARAQAQHAHQAVEAAQCAARLWKQSAIAERQELLTRIADLINSNSETISSLLTQEQGKPLDDARGEVYFTEVYCRYYAEQQLPVELLKEDEHQRVEIHHKPMGVVAGIIPWNYPFLLAVCKLAPALLTGNSFILKPAPTTPVTALLLGELIQELVPAGLVNVLADDNDIGPLLSCHPGIAKISFTGSTPTGKAIMASAADSLKHLTLELGGNDAAIVLDDVKPVEVAEAIFGAAFINSGQVCVALKRLYVHESIYDELCDAIAVLASKAVVGDGMDSSSQFGPVQNRMQYEKVCGLIEEAERDGHVIAGGDIPQGPGYFVPVTVVRDLTDGHRLVDEEPFGPVLPIIKYSDVDEVIERANASAMGLGGSVWSSDMQRAHKLALRLECGTVWVNQHCAFGPDIPFPSTKDSGFGVESGQEGLLEYTVLQVVNINKVRAAG